MMYVITMVFIVLDLLTGLVKALKEKSFSSSIMREGLYHKSGSLFIMFVGALTDFTMKYIDIGVNVPVANAICVYLILMELGSIIENVGKINPEIIPEKITPYFSKLTERSINNASEEH